MLHRNPLVFCIVNTIRYSRCSATSEVFSVSTPVSRCSLSSSSSSFLPACCGSALCVCTAVPPWRQRPLGRFLASRIVLPGRSRRFHRPPTVWQATTSFSCLTSPRIFLMATAKQLEIVPARGLRSNRVEVAYFVIIVVKMTGSLPVSYTHLTLPTIYSV